MSKAKPRGFLTPYKSYMFLDKDPVLDKVRTVVQDSKMSYREVHEKSGVSVACQRAWFKGATRRPQFATVNAVLRACGKELAVVNRGSVKSRSHLRAVS
jgi:hypothetical protein